MGGTDKSKLDWNQFVEDHKDQGGAVHPLMGKGGYVEKQMLKELILRQFELEEAVRDKNRKSLWVTGSLS